MPSMQASISPDEASPAPDASFNQPRSKLRFPPIQPSLPAGRAFVSPWGSLRLPGRTPAHRACDPRTASSRRIRGWARRKSKRRPFRERRIPVRCTTLDGPVSKRCLHRGIEGRRHAIHSRRHTLHSIRFTLQESEDTSGGNGQAGACGRVAGAVDAHARGRAVRVRGARSTDALVGIAVEVRRAVGGRRAGLGHAMAAGTAHEAGPVAVEE